MITWCMFTLLSRSQTASNPIMPRAHKRKRSRAADDPPTVSTVPTLKEFMWKEYANVLGANLTVPLSGKDFNSLAMKKFR